MKADFHRGKTRTGASRSWWMMMTFFAIGCRAFAARGWQAIGAADGASALELSSRSSPDLAIVHLRLTGMSGLDIVHGLRSLDETICIIMLTGYGSIATALTATKLGANHYLSKPADADQILNAYTRINDEFSDSGRESGTPPCPV